MFRVKMLVMAFDEVNTYSGRPHTINQRQSAGRCQQPRALHQSGQCRHPAFELCRLRDPSPRLSSTSADTRCVYTLKNIMSQVSFDLKKL